MEITQQATPVVMIVDDIEVNVRLLEKMIKRMGYTPMTATSVDQALELLKDRLPSVFLLDIVMPGTDGYQFCEMLKNNPVTRDIPVIFVSAVDEISDKEKAFKLGAVDFIHKPYEYGEIAMRLDTHLKLYFMQKELTENNVRLNMVVKEQAWKLEEEQKRLLKAFSTFADGERYLGMETHIEYVAANARLLAQALNFTERYENQISSTFVDAIEIAASIHDIGKVTIPKEILDKSTALSEYDMNIIRQHTSNGSELLRDVYENADDNYFAKMAIDVVRWHHENWDGTGYPDGLKGDEIPLAARIVSIVDTYDVILRERVYMKQHTYEEAIQIMKDETGRKFDPYIMDTFFRIEKQFKKNPPANYIKERTSL